MTCWRTSIVHYNCIAHLFSLTQQMQTKDFTVGKVYEFTHDDYIPTRETGKLVFLLKDADGDTFGRIAPFDFQVNNYPDRLTVVYRGQERFEQTKESVLAQVYKVGETYTFKVWRSDGGRGLLLRDEVNGLTHSNMRVPGAANLKRFAQIDCRVTAVSDQGLQLRYCGARTVNKGGYTLQTFLGNGRLMSEPWMRVVSRVMDTEVLAEAREASSTGDPRWVTMAIQTLVRLLPQWLSDAPGRRRVWVKRLNYTIRTIVESPEYAASFNYDTGRLRGQRHELGRAMEQLEYIDQATQLVATGQAEERIDQTLDTMRRSGWVFQPNRRMGVLMQVLALNPGLAHSHTGDVFEIIRQRRNNRDFMAIFGDAFKIMLSTYIESERSAPNPQQRGNLRELAEAIAIELLLVGADNESEEGFELWDTHRGALYTVAALLTGHSGEAPVRKALLTYCGLNDTPLEYGWDDLDDINRVCQRLLANSRTAVADGTEAVFEGESVRLRADNNRLVLQPADDKLPVRPELTGQLATDMTFSIQLPVSLKDKANAESDNLTRHRRLWEQVRSGLEEVPDKPLSVSRPEVKELAQGDKVEIIVTGQNPMERFEFDCRTLDGRYTGLLAARDVVPYPINPASWRKMFWEDDKPLKILATAVEELPDGRWRFSIRLDVREINNADAEKDKRTGEPVIAKIADTGGIQYKATSSWGYGILLLKRDCPERLEVGDVVEARVESVNFKPDQDKLYINCSLRQTFMDSDGNKDVETALSMNVYEYDSLMAGNLLRDCFKPLEDGWSGAVKEVSAEEVEEAEVRYLDGEAVANLSFLLEQCAALQRSDLRQSYTLLNLAQILADMAGDLARSEQLSIQLQLLEALSRFALDGSMTLETVLPLVERGRRLAATSALLRSRLKEVAILAALDNKTLLGRTQDWAQRGADHHITQLLHLATAYNALEGLGATDIRESIRRRIHKLLSLPTIASKQKRLNVNEDLYHEFKTSAIYPADNHMQPDERAQGFVIAKTVAALLNAEGGTLYIGVDNGGNITGLDADFRYLCRRPRGEYDVRESLDLYNLYLQRNLRQYLGTTVDGLSLVPDFVDIVYEEVEGLWMCRIVVRPFAKAVLLKPEGRLFIRKIGATEEVRDATEKRRFIERRNA